MKQIKNFLWFSSLVITILFLILGIVTLITEEWDGINLYIILFHTMFLLTLVVKNTPLSYKILLTAFNGCLLARNIYITETLDFAVIATWIIVILQTPGVWLKYSNK